MENKGSKFFKKGSAFLIAPALFSSFLPGASASTVGGSVTSKAASESAISKFGAGAVKFLGNHWVKLVLLVGAGLLAWWLCSSNKSEEFPGLGEQINKYNDNNDENNINNDESNINNDINSNYNSNNNNTNVANHNLRNLYREKIDEYKKDFNVNIIDRKIVMSGGAYFRYEWVFVRNCYLIKLSKFWGDGIPGDGWPIYIFPTNDGRVFGFYDGSDKKDLSFMRGPCDLINFVRLGDFQGGLHGKAFDGQLFSTEVVEKCSGKKFLFEEDDFKVFRKRIGDGGKFVALFELIRDNDQNFWTMRNDPNAISKDILLQQQKKMMAMNNNNGMFNMGNIQPQMMPNMNMFNNMPPNNNMGNNGMMMGNNNNQSMGNPQGMSNGFQGNNNNNGGFPQQMGMNNPQIPQGQQGQNFQHPGYNNNNNGNNFNNNNFNNNMMPPHQPPYGNNNFNNNY